MARERKVEEIVRDNLLKWQEEGLVPDLAIEPGQKTDEPIRTRGWTHWHHLFNARGLLYGALTLKHSTKSPAVYINVCDVVDRLSKLCRWDPRNAASGRDPTCQSTFYNQALNTIYNYGTRSWTYVSGSAFDEPPKSPVHGCGTISCAPATALSEQSDIFITDPPYADAVVYHEITEFFIAWLRKRPPAPFDHWVWDSRRPLAIKGEGEEFRHSMVDAYKTMADHMPDNGLQIVMFTHQSASVWADMAQIFWGAGLQVMAAWYIATETTSELKKGGYVQGTVILVLRKRKSNVSGYKDEVVQEVKAEVAEQIDTMSGLNQHLKGKGRIENLFEDADLQMAGYAAALRILTKYEKIDGTDMTKEALRSRRTGEKNLVGEVIDFAVQVANEHMVPEHMAPKLWEGLSGAERFYFKMMDVETTSLRKLDNYQNFAKAFRVGDYGALMGSMEPNKARLRTAKDFKKAGFEIPEFGQSVTRAALYAIFELENDVEGDDVLSHLKDMLPNYHNKRDDMTVIADYIARKREIVDETESRAARILHGLIRNERLG
jgi:putative DNA methylase